MLSIMNNKHGLDFGPNKSSEQVCEVGLSLPHFSRWGSESAAEAWAELTFQPRSIGARA